MSATPDEAPGVPVSEELFAPVGAGVELCYQTYGDPSGEPLLLLMGLGGPMTWWDPVLCAKLAEAGFFVVRYDNRDTGRSSKIRARVTRRQLARAFTSRRAGRAPYTMADLAADAVALLDHLDVRSAHLAGVSMGGMIAQTVAVRHPARVRSLTSIMSTTGRRTVGWQSPQLLPLLVAPRKPGRDAYVRSSSVVWRAIGSPDYPADPAASRARAEETFDRGFTAMGVMRQMMAVLTQPDRTRQLRDVRAPTLVIHGLADRMVHVSGGRATASAVPGAELLLVDGMGHDMPPALFDTFVERIRRTADRAVGAPDQGH
jgi:pimeloyl-ACP methyl ester carboxylesterase